MSYSLNRNATVFYFINIFLFLFIILIFLLALFLRLPNFISSFYSYCVHLVLLSSPLLCFFRSYSFNICSWFYFFTASIHLSSLSYSKKIVLKYFLSFPIISRVPILLMFSFLCCIESFSLCALLFVIQSFHFRSMFNSIVLPHM
jgi:hypothetical protein